MIIQNVPVKKDIVFEKDSDNIEYIDYDYFACTCEDEDEEFFNRLIDIFLPQVNKPETLNRRATLMLKELAKLGWKFEGAGTDMWMGASFSKDATDKHPKLRAYIQCDSMVYAFITAYIIARNLEKEYS